MAQVAEVRGLTFPFLTAYDPVTSGEGSIDPLGLAPLADRLADEIAPGITARMSRVRFLTGIALGAAALERLQQALARDGVTPAYLALEWLVVEAIARVKDAPPAARRIPGIDKARAAILRGERLNNRTYLKTPKVFGFHGVYKRLAIDLGLVDSELTLAAHGERLVRAFQLDQPSFSGYLDGDDATPGGSFRRRLAQESEKALVRGEADLAPGSNLWKEIFAAFRPDGAGAREKSLVRQSLLDPGKPIRHELVSLLSDVAPLDSLGDLDYIDVIYRKCSPDLRVRLDAIRAYEKFSVALTSAFDWIRLLATQKGTQSLSSAEPAGRQEFSRLAAAVPGLFKEAASRLAAVDAALELSFRRLIEDFSEPRRPHESVELLLAHHERIQNAKPPAGKQPWFEPTPGGVVVRHAYRLEEPPDMEATSLHPFRLTTLMSFLQDLR